MSSDITHALCPGRQPDSHRAAQTLQKKSVCGRHQGTLGKDWQPLKKKGTPAASEQDLNINRESEWAQARLFRSPASPGSSSFSRAELRLVMSSVKKLVFSIPESGEVYMVLVQSLSSRFYTQKQMSLWGRQATWTQCGDELLCLI